MSKYSAGNNAALFKALAAPLSCQILLFLTKRPANPAAIAEALGYSDHRTVARQCRKMAATKPPLLELLTTKEGRRGSTKRVYRSIARPVINLESWRQLSKLVRETNTVFVGQAILGDLASSLEAGLFDSRPERTQIRYPMVLDEEGMDEVEDASMAYVEALEKIQARSARRGRGSDREEHNFVAVALAFPVPEPELDDG